MKKGPMLMNSRTLRRLLITAVVASSALALAANVPQPTHGAPGAVSASARRPTVVAVVNVMKVYSRMKEVKDVGAAFDAKAQSIVEEGKKRQAAIREAE